MSLCSSIEILAMAFLDDELAREDRRELELHLLECSSCKRHVDGVRGQVELIRRALVTPPAPGSQTLSIQRALDAEDRGAARSWRRGLLGWLLPGSAALSAAAALVTFAFVQQPSRSSESRGHRAADEALREPGRALQLDVGGPRPQTTFGLSGGPAIGYSDGTRRVDAIAFRDCRRCH